MTEPFTLIVDNPTSDPGVPVVFSPAPEQRGALTPMGMLDRAIASGAGIDVLSKMMDFQERWENTQGRKAFDAAFVAAKAEMPIISKNKSVDFTSTRGRTSYKYEDLAEIVRVITPILAKHGLSHRFRVAAPINEPVLVTCVISHRDGYYEETSLPGPRDESGNKNAIQAVGSTLTYLQRMSLKAALGLAASDDDDGRGSSDEKQANGKITAEEAETLQYKILNLTDRTVNAFCKKFEIASLSDLLAKDYQRFSDEIERKRIQKAANT